MSIDALAGFENQETYTLVTAALLIGYCDLGKLISLNLIYFTYNRKWMRLNISDNSFIIRCYSVNEWW